MVPLYRLHTPHRESLAGYYYEYQTRVTKDVPVIITPKPSASPRTTASQSAAYLDDYRKYGCNEVEELVDFLNTGEVFCNSLADLSVWKVSPEESSDSGIKNIHQINIYNHYIFVDANTGRQIVLLERPLLDVYTCRRDSKNNWIFDRDIVKAANGGLLSSVFGIVYLDKNSMKFRVRLIKTAVTESWKDTVDLVEFEWTVIAPYDKNEVPDEITYAVPNINLSRYDSWLKENAVHLRFSLEGNKSGQYFPDLSCLHKLSKETEKNSPVLCYAYKTDHSEVAAVPCLQCMEDSAAVQEADAVRRAINAFKRGLVPAAFLHLNASDLHPPVYVCEYLWNGAEEESAGDIVQPADSSGMGMTGNFLTCIIYEGDQLIHLKYPHIHGRVCYVSEQAQFCVEVPEEVLPGLTDSDRYFPLVEEGRLNWRLADRSNVDLLHELTDKARALLSDIHVNFV